MSNSCLILLQQLIANSHLKVKRKVYKVFSLQFLANTQRSLGYKKMLTKINCTKVLFDKLSLAANVA